MVTSAPGRRETNKLATRTALCQAAARLVAEQGYEATTVRQIAHAAQVGERTFYRYFDGKDDLLAQDALAWIDALHDAIAGRPVTETPYQAVTRALAEVADQITTGNGSAGAWLLAGPAQPLAVLRRAAPRPLRRLERSIAAAALPRFAPAGAEDTVQERPAVLPAEIRAQLLARVATAALRTAVGYHRELTAAGASSPGVAALLDESFAQVGSLVLAGQ